MSGASGDVEVEVKFNATRSCDSVANASAAWPRACTGVTSCNRFDDLNVVPDDHNLKHDALVSVELIYTTCNPKSTPPS